MIHFPQPPTPSGQIMDPFDSFGLSSENNPQLFFDHFPFQTLPEFDQTADLLPQDLQFESLCTNKPQEVCLSFSSVDSIPSHTIPIGIEKNSLLHALWRQFKVPVEISSDVLKKSPLINDVKPLTYDCVFSPSWYFSELAGVSFSVGAEGKIELFSQKSRFSPFSKRVIVCDSVCISLEERYPSDEQISAMNKMFASCDISVADLVDNINNKKTRALIEAVSQKFIELLSSGSQKKSKRKDLCFIYEVFGHSLSSLVPVIISCLFCSRMEKLSSEERKVFVLIFQNYIFLASLKFWLLSRGLFFTPENISFSDDVQNTFLLKEFPDSAIKKLSETDYKKDALEIARGEEIHSFGLFVMKSCISVFGFGKWIEDGDNLTFFSKMGDYNYLCDYLQHRGFIEIKAESSVQGESPKFTLFSAFLFSPSNYILRSPPFFLKNRPDGKCDISILQIYCCFKWLIQLFVGPDIKSTDAICATKSMSALTLFESIITRDAKSTQNSSFLATERISCISQDRGCGKPPVRKTRIHPQIYLFFAHIHMQHWNSHGLKDRHGKSCHRLSSVFCSLSDNISPISVEAPIQAFLPHDHILNTDHLFMLSSMRRNGTIINNSITKNWNSACSDPYLDRDGILVLTGFENKSMAETISPEKLYSKPSYLCGTMSRERLVYFYTQGADRGKISMWSEYLIDASKARLSGDKIAPSDKDVLLFYGCCSAICPDKGLAFSTLAHMIHHCDESFERGKGLEASLCDDANFFTVFTSIRAKIESSLHLCREEAIKFLASHFSIPKESAKEKLYSTIFNCLSQSNRSLGIFEREDVIIFNLFKILCPNYEKSSCLSKTDYTGICVKVLEKVKLEIDCERVVLVEMKPKILNMIRHLLIKHLALKFSGRTCTGVEDNKAKLSQACSKSSIKFSVTLEDNSVLKVDSVEIYVYFERMMMETLSPLVHLVMQFVPRSFDVFYCKGSEEFALFRTPILDSSPQEVRKTGSPPSFTWVIDCFSIVKTLPLQFNPMVPITEVPETPKASSSSSSSVISSNEVKIRTFVLDSDTKQSFFPFHSLKRKPDKFVEQTDKFLRRFSSKENGKDKPEDRLLAMTHEDFHLLFGLYYATKKSKDSELTNMVSKAEYQKDFVILDTSKLSLDSDSPPIVIGPSISKKAEGKIQSLFLDLSIDESSALEVSNLKKFVQETVKSIYTEISHQRSCVLKTVESELASSFLVLSNYISKSVFWKDREDKKKECMQALFSAIPEKYQSHVKHVLLD